MSSEREVQAPVTSPRAGLPRRVAVNPSAERAMVVVRTCRGEVWMSITPPFTWDAIMGPGKVDELIHVLGLARDEARRQGRVPRPSSSGSSEAHTDGPK